MARWRRSLDEWAHGPTRPSRDFGDLFHFQTYIQRRVVAVTLIGYVVLLGAAALTSALIWGVPQRIAVGLAAIGYWPAAWYLYLRHHYKPEYDEREDRQDPSGTRA